MCNFNTVLMAKDIIDDITEDIEDEKCHLKLNEIYKKLGYNNFESLVNVMTCRVWLKLNPYREKKTKE